MHINKYVLDVVIAVEKFIQIWCKPECKVTYYNYIQAQSVLQDGDVLLSCVDYELSNYFIPGPYKHACVFWKGDIYEAVTHGVRKIPLVEWCMKKDSFAIMRPAFPKMTLEQAEAFLFDQIGKPYDYDFFEPSDSRAWYCSLYVYEFWSRLSLTFAHNFTLRETFGTQTVTPNDFWNAKDKLDTILVIN